MVNEHSTRMVRFERTTYSREPFGNVSMYILISVFLSMDCALCYHEAICCDKNAINAAA